MVSGNDFGREANPICGNDILEKKLEILNMRIDRAYLLGLCLLFVWLTGIGQRRVFGQSSEGRRPAPASTLPIAEDQPPKNPDPKTRTPSCMPKPPRVEDVFDEASLRRAIADKNVAVIVSHGFPSQDQRLLTNAVYDEHVPLFVSSMSKVEGLTRPQVIQILRGQVTDWSQLGRAKGQIHLYLNGGTLQRRAFQQWVATFGVMPDDIQKLGPRYGSDYDDLARIAASDADAMVIGLRELAAPALRLLTVDGVAIDGHSETHEYPLREPVYVYAKRSPEAHKIAVQVMESISSVGNLKHVPDSRVR